MLYQENKEKNSKNVCVTAHVFLRNFVPSPGRMPFITDLLVNRQRSR